MEANDNITEQPEKRKINNTVDKVSLRSKCTHLEDHILFFMGNFTTYIMCGEMTSQGIDVLCT